MDKVAVIDEIVTHLVNYAALFLRFPDMFPPQGKYVQEGAREDGGGQELCFSFFAPPGRACVLGAKISKILIHVATIAILYFSFPRRGREVGGRRECGLLEEAGGISRSTGY
jgi:hypothetical protein